MSHFAKLDNQNIVCAVVVGRQEDDGQEEALSQRTGDVYKQTSYNTRGGVYYNPETNLPADEQKKAFRKNYASVGYFYDEQRDAFIPPQPYNSWTLNEETCLWEPPIPYPADDKDYVWNEENGAWEEIS